MKKINSLILGCLALSFVWLTACKEDEGEPDTVTATIGMNQTVDIEKTVTLDASGSTGSATDVTYAWTVTDPDGGSVTLSSATAASTTFLALSAGTYDVSLTVTSGTATDMTTGTVVVVNPTYALADQMGRPAINTVFNVDDKVGDTKNAFNQTLPSTGGSLSKFTFILDALQTYIFLDPDQFENILGIGNDALAGVLINDVLNSDKNAATAYGTLNGRALGDDVVDVTLILAFSDQSGQGDPASVIPGLITDFVNGNDKEFLTEFPYLATPH